MSSSESRRVVITGLGLISPLGNTRQELWQALTEGRSGVQLLAAEQGEALSTPFAARCGGFTGEIDNFGTLEGDKKKAIRKGLKVMCRECQMGVAAAERALQDSGLKADMRDPERSGVVFGTDYMLSEPEEFGTGIMACTDEERQFHFDKWAQQGMTKMTPLWLLKYLPNMPASHIAIYNDLRGPNNSLTLREAAGNAAVGEALRVIQRGHADLMIAGATGTRIHMMKAVHSALQEEVAAPLNGQAGDPAEASRPFDAERRGVVLGEGAGVVILEELEHAKARGATIYAELSGFGSSTAADKNRVALRDLALANAMRAAMRDAGVTPVAVGHIQAHGLGTQTGDVAEARAVRDVFGGLKPNVPVTAAKSYFGNLGAGSGVVELIAGALALHENKLFPTRNYKTPDPQCEVNVVREATSPGDSFLNLSVTPQGQASCVYVKRYAG